VAALVICPLTPPAAADSFTLIPVVSAFAVTGTWVAVATLLAET